METLTQEQKLIKYAEENNCENLPIKVSENITKIRKLFADVIKIRDSYNVQMKKLINACENNDIEFVNSDVFGDTDDTGILRIEETLEDNKTLLVDVLIGLELHNPDKADTEENTFIICTHYADVSIDNYNDNSTIEIQDMNSNNLAKLIKGDNVQLQINKNYVDGKTFVYDGCHKIYVVHDDNDRAKAKEYDYINETDKEIPISELEDYYLKSCPLRFVQYFNVEREDYNILSQGADCPMFIYY